MKLITIISLLGLLTLFVSCGDDEELGSSSTTDLSGSIQGMCSYSSADYVTVFKGSQLGINAAEAGCSDTSGSWTESVTTTCGEGMGCKYSKDGMNYCTCYGSTYDLLGDLMCSSMGDDLGVETTLANDCSL